MLELDWFCTPVFDFEYKNYILLSYLSEMDKSYAIHKVSPYLLWTEKLVDELEKFQENLKRFQNSMRRDIVGFSWIDGIEYSLPYSGKELDCILEIVEYSFPILKEKIQIGYKLNVKYPQLLY